MLIDAGFSRHLVHWVGKVSLHHYSWEVAADVVADHGIEPRQEHPHLKLAIHGADAVIECVGYTVGQAAHNKYRHAEEQRQEVLVDCAENGQCHNYTRAYRGDDNLVPACSASACYDGINARHNFWILSVDCQHGNERTSDDVTQQDYHHTWEVSVWQKSRLARIELRLAEHDRYQSKSK